MLFVVLVYSCHHVQIDPLVNKLNENKCIDVQQLGDDTGASRLSDDVDKLHTELDKGSILIDCCSCPKEDHSNMHKAVKSCTQLPSGDPDSDKWRIIQLNNTENDTQASSWSKSSIDYVDVMNYSNLSNVVDKVDDKVMEYLGSRTSSIHSEQNEIQDSITVHLLANQNKIIENQEKIQGQLASVDETTKKGLVQSATQHKETQELLEATQEDLDEVKTKQGVIGKYY